MMPNDSRFTPGLLAQLERALGQPLVIENVIWRGYTPPLRLRVRL
jgi:hypothetical protein